MPARRRHRRPRPAPTPEQFVLDATDLLAPPPGRPDPHGGRPPVLWGRPTPPLLDWPAALTDLYRHLLLPRIARAGHHVQIAALGTRVVATHLDGQPILRAEPADVLRARNALTGHRRTLDPTHVHAYALLRDDLAALLGPELTSPEPTAPEPTAPEPTAPGPRAPGAVAGLDLQLVLAAAAAGFNAADVVTAHRTGTLTPDRIALLAALLHLG